MKFDGVAPYDRTFPTQELDSKLIGQNNYHVMVNMLKADVESTGEGKNDIASPIESKSCEETDPSQYSYSPGPQCYVDIDDSSKNDQNEGDHIEASYSLPTGKIGLAEKETDFYKKTVTEIELPETIACFTDGTCHTVKDICIDEGAHSLEKVFVESNEDQKTSSRFNHSVSNGNYNLTKEMADSTKEMTDYTEPISHDLKFSSINEPPVSVVDKDGAEQCSSGSLLTGGDKLDTVAPSVEAISEKQVLPLQEFDTDPWKEDSSSFNCINDQKPSIVHQKIDQGTLEVRNSAKSTPSAVEEPIQSNGTKGSPANGKVGVIMFHFDSGVATISGSEESTENTDNQQSGQARYFPKSEEASLDGATASARSPCVHHGHGDSNFYGPASLSGRIVSSGHIPYSGSISLRSDSSTTSAHSFAFPILQSEWNYSPVKMAKADRRHLRKHRRWIMGLLCCRF